MQVNEHIIEIIPAYALGSLEPEEAAQAAEHLAVCAQCRQELRAYLLVTDDLALAAPAAEPPADLKQKILARARQSAGARAAQAQPVSLGWAQRIAHALRRSSPAWGLASLALVLLLGASNLALWQRLQQAEIALQTQNAPAAMSSVHLTGSETAPGATGTLVISMDGEYGTLVVDGLPELENRQQYQLWLIQDGQRDNGGVFSVDAEGYGSLSIAAPQPLNSYDAFGVTIEPAGGSPGPTGPRVLGGQF